MKKLYAPLVFTGLLALFASGCKALDCGCPMTQETQETPSETTTGLQPSATAR
jgi:hypothetical protein